MTSANEPNFLISVLANGLTSPRDRALNNTISSGCAIAHIVGSGAIKAIAQPLPMAVIMRFFGGLIVWFAALRGHRRNMPCRSIFAISNCQMTAWPRGKSGRYRRLLAVALRQREDFDAVRGHADRMLELRRQRTVARD